MLDFALGRFEGALAGFRSAERLQAMLVTPHAFTAQMREWLSSYADFIRSGRCGLIRCVLTLADAAACGASSDERRRKRGLIDCQMGSVERGFERDRNGLAE